MLSSYGEIEHSITSPLVQLLSAATGMGDQPVFRDQTDYQPLLFIADSFEEVFEMVNNAGKWLQRQARQRRRGEPGINEADGHLDADLMKVASGLESFRSSRFRLSSWVLGLPSWSASSSSFGALAL